MNRQILKEEEEKAKIQKDLSILTDRLSKINESLARKVQARNEYDRTVQETEVRERESERETTKTATRKKSLYQQRPFVRQNLPRIQVFISEMCTNLCAAVVVRLNSACLRQVFAVVWRMLRARHSDCVAASLFQAALC